MYSVAERELCRAQFVVELFGELRGPCELLLEQSVPELGRWTGNGAHGIGRSRAAAHLAFAPASADAPELATVVVTLAAATCAAALGAPMTPEAAPTPSISSQRGHGFDAAPLSARSMTRRDILSSTISK